MVYRRSYDYAEELGHIPAVLLDGLAFCCREPHEFLFAPCLLLPAIVLCDKAPLHLYQLLLVKLILASACGVRGCIAGFRQ